MQPKGIEDERVTKEGVFKSLVDAANEFYKLIVTVASAFLGGSLLFIEKLSPPADRSKSLLRLLGTGWFFLVLSVLLIMLVQRCNLKSGHLVMDGDQARARKTDRWTSWGTTAAVVSLVLGVSLMMFFGYISLMSSAK